MSVSPHQDHCAPAACLLLGVRSDKSARLERKAGCFVLSHFWWEEGRWWWINSFFPSPICIRKAASYSCSEVRSSSKDEEGEEEENTHREMSCCSSEACFPLRSPNQKVFPLAKSEIL